MFAGVTPTLLLGRSLLLQAAGAAVAAGSAAYYFTHPQRVVAELPADLDAQAEHVYLGAADGTRLHALWLPGQGPGGRVCERTIVHHHGYNGSAGLLLARKPVLPRAALRITRAEPGAPLTAWPLVRAGLAAGFNWLLVDARAHGRSDGEWDPSGAQQLSDLMAWVKWLRLDHGQLWAGLWGNSFGGTLGLALAMRPAGGGFDAMVLDSPAITPRGLYAGAVSRPLYLAIQPVLRRSNIVDLARKFESTRTTMPIFLIHGLADDHVPSWQSEQAHRLLEAPDRPELTALWLVPAANHLQSLEVAPDEYVRRTLSWFDRWM